MKTRFLRSLAFLSLGAPIAGAASISNSGFESDAYTSNPGYISGNGGSLTDWTASNNGRAGLNPAGGNPFANNGAVPEGSNVAFLQGDAGGVTTLTSNGGITGLVPGRTYNLTYRLNNRLIAGANDPEMGLVLGGSTVLRNKVNAVGASNPYKFVSYNFVATSTTASLALDNHSLADKTLLFDAFQVTEVTPKISVTTWSGDATSGIDSSLTYTHAFNLGSAAGATINGVSFTGVAGGNPNVGGSFSYNMGNATGDSNNITTGGSAALSDNFVFNNGTPTLTLEGLTAGQLYRTSLFTVGFDGVGFGRAATILSPDGEMLTVDVNTFGNNNGARIDIEFTATGTSEDIKLTSLFGSSSFHTYGFANAQIPEPSVVGVLAISVLGLGLRRRRH